MTRMTLTLCVCLGLLAPTFATAQPAAPAASLVDSDKLAEQLKEKPDDQILMNQYMITNLRKLQSIIATDPDGAEQILGDMKSVIDSLKPETPQGKQLLGRAKGAIGFYTQQVEIGRVTLDEVAAKLKASQDDKKAVSAYMSKVMSLAGPAVRSDPDKAEKLINDAKTLLAAVKAKAQQDDTKKLIDGMLGSFSRMEGQIKSAKRLAALVGMDAAPLGEKIKAWVNGDPLKDTDLKGKVVLLDFWAVWCGPCVGTFPYMRDWHEKYGDDGLVIIGLTNYYNYTWDDAANRPKRMPPNEKVTPEQENQMLAKMAEAHDLHHRFAVQEDRSLAEYYAVGGIPHFVLIDRNGKIQLVLVGGGPSNAAKIAANIEKLIAE